MKRRLLFILFSCVLCIHIHGSSFLFDHGKTDYAIVLDANASPTEKIAAQELQKYIEEMSSVRIAFAHSSPASKHHIYIGYQDDILRLTGHPQPASAEEGFFYCTVNDDLLIWGGSDRGTMYGVFAFLEQQLGVLWLTSDYTYVPHRRQWALPPLNHHEQPAFTHRLDFIYDALHHPEWGAHNRLNSNSRLSATPFGKMSAYWGIHSFHTILPPERYFETHPEYFSLRDGKRTDKAQLCLSNSSMRKEFIANVKKIIADNPGYWCYDVSQNDNSFPCECVRCKKLVRKYGGESGAMLWFVNQVAKAIKKSHPDVLIGTFAYRYTRHAPTSKIKPADNVVVRLCDIECCMAHPLTECLQNKSFLEDMDAWKKITSNIYVWDYTVGFNNYLLPFPNFKALNRNFQYFTHSGVIGILEEGAHNAPWSEFSEMKQWIIAKLLWNPYQNIDSLAYRFIESYYGKAASDVKNYYDLCQQQVTSGTHFTIKIDWKSPIYSDRFITSGLKQMTHALSVSNNQKDIQKRIKRLSAQLYYLKLKRNSVASATDGSIKTFKEIIQNDRTIIHENGLTLEKLMEDLKYY